MIASFFSFLKVAVLTGAAFFAVLLVLLSLPKSRLRAVGLELTKYAAAAALVLLVPLPVDAIPDPVPVLGYADDLGYLVGAGLAISSALKDRKQRRFELACENARMAREAGIDLADHDVEGGAA